MCSARLDSLLWGRRSPRHSIVPRRSDLTDSLWLPASKADYCRGRIAHYKVPRYLRFVEEFPMAVTGKIQKFVMRDRMREELALAETRTAWDVTRIVSSPEAEPIPVEHLFELQQEDLP
jgi:hypothetical protein